MSHANLVTQHNQRKCSHAGYKLDKPAFDAMFAAYNPERNEQVSALTNLIEESSGKSSLNLTRRDCLLSCHRP